MKRCEVYGEWCMMYGVWYMMYGVWRMEYGVMCVILCIMRGVIHSPVIYPGLVVLHAR